MQELTSAPQMASPYTPAGGSNMPALMAQQPKLGTPVPGTTGGLAAKPGLTVFDNPLPQAFQSNPQQSAQQAQSYGRGDDTMLIHMTPDEVGGLQQLAMAHGGSLTINPHTGLPEAGWLGKLLPTLLGFGLNFIPGVGPLLAAGITAAGTTAVTGDLQKGLMAGLGAYGGASLGNALNLGTSAVKAAAPELISNATMAPATSLSLPAVATPTLAGGVVPGVAQSVATQGALLGGGTAGAASAANVAASGGAGIIDKFGAAAREGLKAGTLPYKLAPYAAGMGLLNTASELSQPNLPKYTPEKETPYVPMGPGKREVMYQTPEQMRQSGGAEFTYFTPSNPAPVPLSQFQQDSSLTDEIKRDYGYADGGLAALPAPEGFQDLVNYFGANNPGAITASMYPVSATPAQATSPAATAAAPAREQIYSFAGRPPATSAGGTGTGTGTGTGFNFGDLSGIDWSQYLSQYGGQTTPTTPTQPNYNTDTFDSYNGYGDWRDSWMPQNDQPVAPAAPVQPTTPTSGYGDWRDSWMPQDNQPAAPVQPTTPSYDFSQPALQGNLYADTSVNDQPNFDFGGFDFSRYTPSEPVQPAAPEPAAPTQPSYDFSNFDFSQFAPEPSYNYEPYTPDFSSFENSRAPEFSAPSYDFMQAYTPEPAPSYDFSQFEGQNYPMYDGFYDSNYMAKGGSVNMGNGSFVVDARTVSELGNGSSNAGKEILARLGGRPLNGPGDGVSDSIPARIGGSQEARVARDEVVMPPEAVRRMGGGSEKRGTQKLYALMDKAHKARKKAKRGQDTKLAKGLGALA